MPRARPAEAQSFWAAEECLACGRGAAPGECAFCPACHEAFHVGCAPAAAPCPACTSPAHSVFPPPPSTPLGAPMAGPMLRVGATAMHAVPAAAVDGGLRACHLRRMTLAGARHVVSVSSILALRGLDAVAVLHVSAVVLAATPGGGVAHGAHVYSGPPAGVARALGLDVLAACVHAATSCALPKPAPRMAAAGDENARPGRHASRPKKAGASAKPAPVRPLVPLHKEEIPAAAPTHAPAGCARTRSYRRAQVRVRAAAPLPRVSVADGSLCVARSEIAGFGLFAARHFAAGSTVAEYVGRVLVDAPALVDALERRYARDGLLGAATLYLFRLDARRVIDATRAGGPARFANHSCAPNCEAVAAAVPRGLRRGVVLRALADIAPGDEVTFDYRVGGRAGEPGAGRASRCRCGAAACRGTLDA